MRPPNRAHGLYLNCDRFCLKCPYKPVYLGHAGTQNLDPIFE